MVLLIASASNETHRQFDSLFSETECQLHHVTCADDASHSLLTDSQITLAILDSSLGEAQLRPFLQRFGLAGASLVRRPIIIYLDSPEQLARSPYVEWGCHQFLSEPLSKEATLELVHRACAWMHKRILVLAENEELVAGLTDLFSQDMSATYQVKTVSGIAEAMGSASFHLLISEGHLFERNASEILLMLRYSVQRVPLMLLAEFGQAKSNWPSGVDLVLTKPINLMTLRERARELLAIYRTPSVHTSVVPEE